MHKTVFNCMVGYNATVTTARSLFICSINFAAAPARAAIQSTGKKRFRLQPESTDAKFLVSHVSGLNYFKEGEAVKLKSDSEYPDWLWNLDLKRPQPFDHVEADSKEFWEHVAFQDFVRQRRLLRSSNKTKMVIGRNELRRREWVERIKHRAITAQQEDAGFDPAELIDKLDMRLTLRPQVPTKTVYMDEVAAPSTKSA